MSEFFSEAGSESKQFIPPDYSSSDDLGDSELPYDSDLSDDDDDEDLSEEDLQDEAEAEVEKQIEEFEEQNKNKSSGTMNPTFSSGFGTFGGGQQTTRPSWGSGWGQQDTRTNDFWSNPGGNNNQGNGWWSNNNPGNTWGQQGKQQQEIDRTKKVIFIDFFDGLMETYQSNGQPGFLPRAVYDLKPRFDVWTKLMAFSPDYVFGIAQREFLNDINGFEGWTKVLEGWCCCLSSFLRKQYGSTQILLSPSIYQPKEEVIMMALQNFNKKDCVYIGLQSGMYNQSNQDLQVAKKCGIDYVDLGQLLNNMY